MKKTFECERPAARCPQTFIVQELENDGYVQDGRVTIKVELVVDAAYGGRFALLSEEEREQELRELRGDYDTVSDSIIINTEWSDPVMDPDAELPFS